MELFILNVHFKDKRMRPHDTSLANKLVMSRIPLDDYFFKN